MIYFVLNSEIEIGSDKANSDFKTKDNRFQKHNAVQKKKLSENNIPNYNSIKQPLHFKEKVVGNQPIGLFELMFFQQSKFAYRVKADHERTEIVKAMFIRPHNWKKIYDEHLAEQISQQLEQFKNQLILNYVDSVYFPAVERSRGKTMRQMDKEKIVKVVNLLLTNKKKKVEVEANKEDRKIRFNSREELVDLIKNERLNTSH